MPKAEKAEKTVSVRMPAGAVEELKAYTGQRFSTLVRWTMMELLKRKRAEHATQLHDAQQDVVAVVADIPETMLH